MAKSQSRADIILSLKNNMTRGLSKATRQLNKFSCGLKKIGMAFTGLAVSMGTLMTTSMLMAAKLDDKVRTLAARLQLAFDDKRVRRLNDEINRLGRTTSFTAGEVADLMVVLAQAGKSADEIEVMTESVMQLAKAAGGEAADAADLMAVGVGSF